MKIKKIITIIELLSLTGLFSVGFSSWAIVETQFPSVSGTIDSEDYINYNDFITVRNLDLSDATESGFLLDNTIGSTPTYYGYLTAEIEVDLTNIIFTDNVPLNILLIQCVDYNNGGGYQLINSTNVTLTDTYSISYDDITYTTLSSSNITDMSYESYISSGNKRYHLFGKKLSIPKGSTNKILVSLSYKFDFVNLTTYSNFYKYISDKTGYNFKITSSFDLGG